MPWGKKRGDRTGLPPLEKLPDIQCCDGLCGRTISPEAYIYHWSNFSNAASEEEADHTLARVLSPRLCGKSWRPLALAPSPCPPSASQIGRAHV